MDANEKGAARYRFHERRIWTPAAETRFIRKVFQAFPDAYEIDRDGNPVPLEQLSLPMGGDVPVRPPDDHRRGRRAGLFEVREAT